MKRSLTISSTAAIAFYLILAGSFTTGQSDSATILVDTTKPPLTFPPPRLISETDIPPTTAALSLERGRSFAYVSSVDSLAEGQDPTERMKLLSVGFGAFPVMQGIRCTGISRHGDSVIVGLTMQAKVKNTRAKIAPHRTVHYQRRMATARIDSATGQVLKENRRDSTGQENPAVFDAEYWDFSRTLWDFYGRWMLHLADDFYYERILRYPLGGIRKFFLKTVGREDIGGRECFVVKQVSGLLVPQKADTLFREGSTKTYWVDMEDRVAVRVRDAQLIFNLVVSEKQPAGEKP